MEGGEGKSKHDCALNSWKNQGLNPNTDASGVCQGTPGQPRGRSLQRNAEGSSDLKARLSLLGQNLFRDASGHSPRKTHVERPQPHFLVNPPHQMDFRDLREERNVHLRKRPHCSKRPAGPGTGVPGAGMAELGGETRISDTGALGPSGEQCGNTGQWMMLETAIQ